MLALLCLLPVFDHPLAGWDAHRNRLLPDPPPTVRRKFGYTPDGVRLAVKAQASASDTTSRFPTASA